MGYGKTGKMIFAWLASLLACCLMLACNPEKARSRDKPAESGTREMSIVVNGLERTYLVHVPAAYKPQIPLPLVIMLHGGGGTAKALGCAAATANVSVAGGVRTETYSPCRDSAEVVYIEVEGLGHTWLGGRSLLPERMVGKTSNNRT